LFCFCFGLVWFVTRYLGVAAEWNDTGWWVGYISCAYVIGRLVTSTTWGMLATSYGKRPVILVSALILTISHIMLGISTSITWALVVRFCAGAGNGILPALCSTSKQGCAITNDSKGRNGFAGGIEQQDIYCGSGGLAYMVWACGLIVGPGAIGLLLPEFSSTGTKQNSSHPFLEPCFFAAGFSMIVFILCWLHLNEKQMDAGVRAVASTSVLEWRKIFEDGTVAREPGSPVYQSNVSRCLSVTFCICVVRLKKQMPSHSSPFQLLS
jgi:MFS family permease